jgi:hypothetical protein
MASQTYDHSEFVPLRYYAGTHGCAASTARISYYGFSGTPNQVFNGTHQITGAGPVDAQGGQYMDIIRSRYFDPAPVRIVIDSFNPATGAVSATVTMYSTTDSFDAAEDNFHFILIEDDLNAEDTHVTRALISNGISLDGAGNTVVFNETFAIDGGWDQAKLEVVAFVQRQDKEIVQTASTYAQPGFSIRAMVPFGRNIIGPSDGTYQSDDVTIMNVGQTETFTISLVVDEAPPGWTATFSDSLGTPHTDPWAFGLTAQESTTFTVNVTPATTGFMRYHLVVTSMNLAKDLEVPFVYSTDDVDVLLVDDDGGNDYEGYFLQALNDVGLTAGFWNLSFSKLDNAVATSIKTLIWNIGLGYPSLDATDRAFLETHLDNGYELFITGQDIGWDLIVGQDDDLDAAAFYHDYLHANYLSDDVNRYDVDGVDGDPVSDGIILHIQGEDGADNQEYPSRIAPYDADAVEIFRYTPENWGAGIRSIDSVSGAKVVYLAFGYEAINNAADREDLMRSAIYWLKGILFKDGFESGDMGAWTMSTP